MLATKWIARAGVAAAALACAGALTVPASGQSADRTRAATDFVDSIGLNLHLYYSNSAYYQHYDEVRNRLKDLGVHHIRDGVNAAAPAFFVDRLEALGRDGIKANYITNEHLTSSELVAFVNKVPDSVESIEAPNEHDLSKDPDWIHTLQTYVPKLYRDVKSTPALSAFPVVGPSMTKAMSYASVGDLSANLDFGNIHDYFGGRNPGNTGYGNNGFGSIPYSLRISSPVHGAKPVMATETGYCTLPAAPGTPPDINARYEPRLFLEQFNHGIVRTYQYEFVDEGTPGKTFSNCGLLDSDARPKPSYFALKNFIAMVHDAGPSFTPPQYGYTLEGATQHVDHTVLAKHDGTVFLLLWVEQAGFDTNAQRYLNVGPQTVTVRFAQPVAHATAYQFDDAGNLPATNGRIAGSSAQLTVTDRVIVVKIDPH